MGKLLDTGKLQKKFGQRIRKMREEKGLTQEKLAELIDVDRSYMGFVERGERNVTLDKIGKLADALGVKKEELFKF